MKILLLLLSFVTLFWNGGGLGKNTLQEVMSLSDSYRSLIDDIDFRDGDIAFKVRDAWIYYQGGRMLAKNNLSSRDKYASLFYPYPPGRLENIPPFNPPEQRASDFLESMFGRTSREIRTHCQSVSFLKHSAFVNRLCVEPLKNVEQSILEAARHKPEVREFIADLKIMYSFQRKNVIGTGSVSYHSYGLALDLIPKSYQRKHVYWKWSAVMNKTWYRTPWFLTPLESRWSPPQSVIDAFEENGFIWGGKWVHFDTVHFEYRPELLKKSSLWWVKQFFSFL